MTEYGTAYVPANDTTVPLFECGVCGNIFTNMQWHEQTDPHKRMIAVVERKGR